MTEQMFMSPEWMAETEKILRAMITSQTTQNASLSLTMTVENLPSGETKTLVFATEKGEMKTFRLADPGSVNTEFSISGDYRVYEKLFKGQLEPASAIMGGELKFSGNMFKAIRLLPTLEPFFAVFSKVPTRF
ncbi:MAG TPA: SCP2 sterol-binding domain-containing protein [Anaerolineaceae bacterium]|nr:SCP2 sterol-binding domain-containing protein [Anaerolineaceae bacterium]